MCSPRIENILVRGVGVKRDLLLPDYNERGRDRGKERKREFWVGGRGELLVVVGLDRRGRKKKRVRENRV